MPDSYGLKIAPYGVEVTTATEDQLSFISTRQILKVSAVGIVSGPTTISHTFDYAPIFLTFQNYSSGAEDRVRSAGGDSCYVTVSDLVIPATGDYKYYIFYKTA